MKESNARVVRWSDGTRSLLLGGEVFDIHKTRIDGDFNHLFVQQVGLKFDVNSSKLPLVLNCREIL